VLAILLLVLLYNPLTALAIIVVVGLLYSAIYSLVRKRLAHIGLERQVSNANRFQSCNEVLGGIKDVKVTHATTAYQEKFHRASRLLSRHMATSDTLSQSPLYLVEAVGYSGLIILALVLMLHRGDIAHVLPALGLYGFAAYRMLPSVQIMYRGFAKLKFSSAALDAIYNDLRLPDDEVTNPGTALIPHKEIRLQNIRYAYPSSPDKPVLDQFNLVIPVGTSIGIVGRTGAGKSTLMDILLGLLQPQAGALTVDGVPVSTDKVAAWQCAIGYVPQHIYLADATVAENIAFGVARETIDMRAVERAAHTAQIHDFIVNDLPQGYATMVGDRGIRLSGGQIQRVGIARALYRDPPVLLMDEATSALDAQTEKALSDAIAGLSGQKTIVVIAHKTTSLAKCDMVVSVSIASNSTASVPHTTTIDDIAK
jgi:ABC-type multidrug transport system fused ATPase/permease subunit